jgi:hypothetical protein
LPYTDESKTAKALGLDVRTAANDEVVPWPDTHWFNKLLSAQGYLTPFSESHQQKYQHLLRISE